MEKVKMFVETHKKEIAITTALIFSFFIGYKHGAKRIDHYYDKLISDVFIDMLKF